MADRREAIIAAQKSYRPAAPFYVKSDGSGLCKRRVQLLNLSTQVPHSSNAQSPENAPDSVQEHANIPADPDAMDVS